MKLLGKTKKIIITRFNEHLLISSTTDRENQLYLPIALKQTTVLIKIILRPK